MCVANIVSPFIGHDQPLQVCGALGARRVACEGGVESCPSIHTVLCPHGQVRELSRRSGIPRGYFRRALTHVSLLVMRSLECYRIRGPNSCVAGLLRSGVWVGRADFFSGDL